MKRFLQASGFVAAASLLAWVYVEKVHEPLRRGIEARRYPGLPPAGPMGKSIEEDTRRRKAGEVAYRVRRLSERISEAEREGRRLTGLRERLENASLLADKGYFRDAARTLNVVEARLALREEPLRSAGEDEGIDPAPEPTRRRRR